MINGLSNSAISHDPEWPSRPFTYSKPFQMQFPLQLHSIWQDFSWHKALHRPSATAEPLIVWLKQQMSFNTVLSNKKPLITTGNTYHVALVNGQCSDQYHVLEDLLMHVWKCIQKHQSISDSNFFNINIKHSEFCNILLLMVVSIHSSRIRNA